MKRTKLRFLFTPLWILNIITLFGLLYTLLPQTQGQINIRILSIITLPLFFIIYITGDVFLFKRRVFLKIAGFTFLVEGLIHISLLIIGGFYPIYLILGLLSIASGIYILYTIFFINK